MGLGIALWNFYQCHNSFLLIRMRKNKFYQHENIYAFFCYFGDLFFAYWRDMIRSSKIYKKAKAKKKLAT